MPTYPSSDHALFNASQLVPVKGVKSQKIPSGVYNTIGPSWFDSFSLLKPLPMKYIYQLPLTVGTVHNTVTFAKRGLAAFGNEKLEAIEIGNEPNVGLSIHLNIM